MMAESLFQVFRLAAVVAAGGSALDVDVEDHDIFFDSSNSFEGVNPLVAGSLLGYMIE
ncbi:MAG: hypothetical protein P1S59_11600 [bacterium]|nr:hypothetical protein [bacterium]